MDFSQINMHIFAIILICVIETQYYVAGFVPVTYTTLYKSGITAYNNGKWIDCYEFMTKSLEEYKVYTQSLIECKADCRYKHSVSIDDISFDIDFLKIVLQRSDCLRRCKLQKIEHQLDSDTDEKMRKDFENMSPYNYLQMCAYKLEKYEVAAAAAYTFLLANPEHEVMKRNIAFYQKMPQIKLEYFVDQEKKLFQTYFDKVLEFYKDGDYQGTAMAVENTLREFYKESENCELLCEMEVGNSTGKDLYNVIADQWINVLRCQSKCAEKMTTVHGESTPNFLPELYNYLQFSYYKGDSKLMAAQAVASYLLFKPRDQVMRSNRDFYISDEGLASEDFIPYQDALIHHNKQKMYKELLEFVNTQYTYSDVTAQKRPGFNDYDDADGEFSLGASLSDEGTERNIKGDPGKENPLWRNQRHNIKHKRMTDDGTVDENNGPALAVLGMRDDKFLSKLNKYYEEKGLTLVGEEEELKGKTRVAVDGILNDAQCGQLIQLAKVGGKQGDGYSGLEHKSSPHTSYEKFEGVTIMKAAEMASNNQIRSNLAELYLDASEASREFLETYYNLKQTLYFHYTHLVCRTALDDQSGREDLSHPLHSDNCLMQEDHSCIRKRPAYTERDFSALLYLNGDFEGGDFVFAGRDLAIQHSLKPECGRMVGFEASTYHGVEAVTKGTRCAVALWFTLDQPSREMAHTQARTMLQGIQKRKIPLKNPVLESLVKTNGYDIVMTESDLNGPERFVSDKVASEQQCDMLVKLANQAASVGDGYEYRKDKSSPHTDFEEFKGIDVAKAAKDSPHEVGGYNDDDTELLSKSEIYDGLTLVRAAQMAAGEEADVNEVNLYLQLSEKSRELVEKYFNLSQELYFDYTHLVCRTALDDSNNDRSDLSHPIHSDNCMIQPNGDCIKERPAYIQRDYSALLYLSNDFRGGEFFFAHKNLSVQSSVIPKCGRLVGFNASNYHGVKAVLSGQRCAIAMWYTLDPKYKEAAHGIAKNILKGIGKPRLQKPPASEGSQHGGEL